MTDLSLLFQILKANPENPCTENATCESVCGLTVTVVCHRLWDQEVRKATKELRKPNLVRVLMQCYGRPYIVAGLFAFLLVCSADSPVHYILSHRFVVLSGLEKAELTFEVSERSHCISVDLKGDHQSDPATSSAENNHVL